MQRAGHPTSRLPRDRSREDARRRWSPSAATPGQSDRRRRSRERYAARRRRPDADSAGAAGSKLSPVDAGCVEAPRYHLRTSATRAAAVRSPRSTESDAAARDGRPPGGRRRLPGQAPGMQSTSEADARPVHAPVRDAAKDPDAYRERPETRSRPDRLEPAVDAEHA